MANHVGVFANVRTFLDEGKKTFSTFMKYTLCKHRSQSETAGRLSVRNVHIPHVQQLHQFKHLEAWMCQSRIQVVWGPAWWDYSVQESISHKAEDTNQPVIIRFPAFTLSVNPIWKCIFQTLKDKWKGKSSGPSVTPGWTASALRDPASHPGTGINTSGT